MKICSIRLPALYPKQEILGNWSDKNPDAQVLVCPSGTKSGKSLGASVWILKEALANTCMYCVWLAPTYYKAKIGYRYMKLMLPIHPTVECIDGLMEIRLGNRSFIKFLHGKDAETTVEGEAIDRFVIDESGKISQQVWYSLYTTITQTRGLGIITGTPRGFGWYYEEYRKAKAGDPFYVHATLMTKDSPYVAYKSIKQAKKLLPRALYLQYYEAQFISMSTVFGDVSSMFDASLEVNPGTKFWIHPDEAERNIDTVTGWDMAKHKDYSVFYTTNINGKMVGYARFRRIAYDMQVSRLKHYLDTFFKGDKLLRYDATGVGVAVGDMIVERDIDVSITPVVFTQKSKQDMVNRTTMAIERGWHKAPRIEEIEHEFGSYELRTSKSGAYSYAAPVGEHDDVVSAALLSISGAYYLNSTDESEKLLAAVMLGSENDSDDDIMEDASSEFADTEDDSFFNADSIDADDADDADEDDVYDFTD